MCIYTYIYIYPRNLFFIYRRYLGKASGNVFTYAYVCIYYIYIYTCIYTYLICIYAQWISPRIIFCESSIPCLSEAKLPEKQLGFFGALSPCSTERQSGAITRVNGQCAGFTIWLEYHCHLIPVPQPPLKTHQIQ